MTTVSRQTRKRRIVSLERAILGMTKLIRSADVIRAVQGTEPDLRWFVSTGEILRAILIGVTEARDRALAARALALVIEYEESVVRAVPKSVTPAQRDELASYIRSVKTQLIEMSEGANVVH